MRLGRRSRRRRHQRRRQPRSGAALAATLGSIDRIRKGVGCKTQLPPSAPRRAACTPHNDKRPRAQSNKNWSMPHSAPSSSQARADLSLGDIGNPPRLQLPFLGPTARDGAHLFVTLFSLTHVSCLKARLNHLLRLLYMRHASGVMNALRELRSHCFAEHQTSIHCQRRLRMRSLANVVRSTFCVACRAP